MKINLKKIYILLAIGVIMLVSACGDNAIKEKTISANNIVISGNGSDHIKVVDGDYTMKTIDSKVIIPIKVELIRAVEVDNPRMGNLTLIPIDNSGAAVPDIGLNFTPATLSDWGKVEDLLSSSVGTITNISFEWSYFSDKKRRARIMQQTENFEITRADIQSKSSSSSANGITNEPDEDESEEEAISKASKKTAIKIDKMLDDYDKYVTSYIDFVKSTKNDDSWESMDKLDEMYESAEEFEDKFDDIDEDDMSAAQMKRYLKISTKLTDAAIDMAY